MYSDGILKCICMWAIDVIDSWLFSLKIQRMIPSNKKIVTIFFPRISRQRWEIGKGVNIMNDHCSYINGLNPPPAIIFSIFNYLNYFILGFEKFLQISFFLKKEILFTKNKIIKFEIAFIFLPCLFLLFQVVCLSLCVSCCVELA